MSRRDEEYDDDDEGDGDGYVHELRNDDGKKKNRMMDRFGDTSDGKTVFRSSSRLFVFHRWFDHS